MDKSLLLSPALFTHFFFFLINLKVNHFCIRKLFFNQRSSSPKKKERKKNLARDGKGMRSLHRECHTNISCVWDMMELNEQKKIDFVNGLRQRIFV